MVIEKAPKYEISNKGNIRNNITKKLLSPFKQNRGYLQICLSTEFGYWRPTIHRLVAYYFLGPSDKEVNHKDLNKTNNNMSNLEYVSRKENMEHASKMNVWSGIKPHSTILTKEQVLEIRNLYKNKTHSYNELANIYNVGKSNIAKIIQRKSWKEI